MIRGKFITIEGGEGAGKSTSMAYLQALLVDTNHDLVCTREPGGTQLAESMRQLLLGHQEEYVDPYTELLLMFAARRQHVTQVIEPALLQGKWVLCDRFTDASYAYQGYGRGLSLTFIDHLAYQVHGTCNPDLTLLLDIDVEVGMQRVRQRSENNLDRIESEQLSFFQSVRQGYLSRAEHEPERFCIIDANNTLEVVQDQLAKVLEKFS